MQKISSVSILGLGIIGQAWAKNLQADGISTQVWNRTPKDFPGFVPDLVEAIATSDLIILVVADPAAVASILDQITPYLNARHLLVQSSTISSQWTKTFAKQVESTGAKFLEAPFTGSKLAAEARQTVFYVGGEKIVVELAEPILKKLSKAILHIGPLGSASSLKLAMNMNIAMVMQSLTESLAFARKAGISDEIFFEALKMNVSRSGVSDLKEPLLRENKFSPQFSLKHMNKDLGLALGDSKAFSLPQLEALKAIYNRGMELGMGDEDFSGLIRLLE